MNRTLYRSYTEGVDYKNSDQAVRVNLYGASGLTDNELDSAVTATYNILANQYNRASRLDGFNLYGYHTDASISQTIAESHNDLIEEGYNAISGGPYEDEHAVVVWIYWDHESDSSNCGPDKDPCPDYFAMGHDINNDATYPAYRREPYVFVSPGSTDLYDIHQAFVYVNQYEQDPANFEVGIAHELGHVLVNYDAYQDQNLVPDDRSQHADHYLGTRLFNGYNYYNTTMAKAGNREAVENGSCSDSDSSSYEKIDESSCYTIAVNESSKYFHNNVDWWDATTITVDDPWQTYTLDSNNQIVIAKPLSNAGPQPAHSRVRNVTDTGFECRIEEWQYQNEVHYEETVGRLTLELGNRILNNGTEVDVGTVTTDETWRSVSLFETFGDTPVVLTQSQTFNGFNPIVTRVRNVSTSGFEVRLQEEEAEGGHRNETIGFMAIHPGTGFLNGVQYEADVVTGVDDNWSTIFFANSYVNPVFIADMQTFNGSDPCGLRYRNLTDSSVEIKVEEEQSVTDEMYHAAAEDVGYFVIERANS